ncbi:hypothetical protein CTheo_8267 [Ceratobasidium theobromae]|uniref:Uncharacterized protein n=1 Tax=Ceratobasidium theobromae TaxID=1582974 RepID=A0A5N5Q922_9AGAM|nr:hypothetical protein CTheo_8267 [Ceratobasidium theobromae]
MRLPNLIVALIQTASFYLGGFDPDDPLPTDLRVDMTFIPGGAKSMIVRVQITNEGSQLYRVLESPTSLIDQPDPVDKYGADKFYPTRKDDPEKEPKFLGAAYKWSPEDAALEGQYTIFGSGAMKTYDYELSDLYDFSKSGPGDYVLTPNPYILLLDLDGNIEEGAYKVPPQLEFTIPPSYWDAGSDQQVVRTSTRNVTAETQAFHSCDNACPTRNNCLGKIQVAAAAAVNIAQDAKAHLDANYNGWSVRLRDWFGVRTPRRAQTVRQTVNNLVAEDFTLYTVSIVSTCLFE